MRVAPVSGDLLVKLTLMAVAVGVVVYGTRKATAAVQAMNPVGTVRDVLYGTADYFGNAWTSGFINPASTNNAIYTGVNNVLFPDQSDTLGTWFYNLIHPDENLAWKPPQATQADVRRIDNALGRPAGADVFYTPYGAYGGI